MEFRYIDLIINLSKKRIIFLVFLCFAVTLLHANAITARASTQDDKFCFATSPYGFIRSFYDWYADTLIKTDGRLSDDQTRIAYSVLSDKLRTKLLSMDEAQSHCNEIVTPDYDPIIEANDSTPYYEIDRLWKVGSRYRAKLYGVDHGYKAPYSDFIVEFEKTRSGWKIVDFYQPPIPDKIHSLTNVLATGDWTCHNPKK